MSLKRYRVTLDVLAESLPSLGRPGDRCIDETLDVIAKEIVKRQSCCLPRCNCGGIKVEEVGDYEGAFPSEELNISDACTCGCRDATVP